MMMMVMMMMMMMMMIGVQDKAEEGAAGGSEQNHCLSTQRMHQGKISFSLHSALWLSDNLSSVFPKNFWFLWNFLFYLLGSEHPRGAKEEFKGPIGLSLKHLVIIWIMVIIWIIIWIIITVLIWITILIIMKKIVWLRQMLRETCNWSNLHPTCFLLQLSLLSK